DSTYKRLTTKPEPNTSRYYYDESRQSPPVYASELQFATLCLADPALGAHGERLLGPMLAQAHVPVVSSPNRAAPNSDYISRIRAAWDRLGATRAGAPDALTNGVPPRWFNASARSVWF